MKSKLNPASVGSFVIGGIILVAIGLMSFQSIHFFNKPVRFISYFDESVQGLDIGSAVKLRGVSVGSVVAIKVHYSWQYNKSEIAVICELTRKALSDRAGEIIRIADPSILNQLVKDGLRAKIDLVGITGLQYIQLDFMDPLKFHAEYPTCDTCFPIIPVVDSGMSRLTDNLVKISESMSKVDIEGISKTLKSLLTSLNQKVESLDLKNLNLKKMTSQITSAAEAIQQLAGFLQQNPSSIIFGRKRGT